VRGETAYVRAGTRFGVSRPWTVTLSYDMQPGKCVPAVSRNMLPPSSGNMEAVGFFATLTFICQYTRRPNC
jgi:hypothetical protein